jgi:putative aldouronate transport system substrate-binding protein
MHGKKIVLTLAIVALGTAVFTQDKPLEITFFVRGGTANASVAADNPVVAELDKRTGATMRFIWLADPEFTDTFSLQVANDELPMVVAIEKNALLLKGIAEGKFWDIGPYIKDYPNLAKINPIILENTKVNGVLYGLPKTRPLGRNGFVFRQDWFNAVGLKKLETTDDFYAMLRAFTNGDPDRNGKRDTYGMAVSSYRGTFEEIAVWFGSPNGWGRDAAGKLVPSFMTPEYRSCLEFLRKCYSEGLINQDFAVLDPANWNKEVSQGRAGVIVDITGRSAGIVRDATAAGKPVIMNILGAVSGPAGYRVMATDGFAGLLVFSKVAIRDEKMLRKVLSVMDYLASDEGRDLMLLGIEGKDWTKADTTVTKLKYDGQKSVGPDIAQIMVFASAASGQVPFTPDQPGKLRTEPAVQAENENFLVTNPAIGLTSSVQSKMGGYLQDLIDDARIRYIMGLIDLDGYDKIIDRWKQAGGNTLIEEINKSNER